MEVPRFSALLVPVCSLDLWYLQKCLPIPSWTFLSDVLMSCLFDVCSGVDRDFYESVCAVDYIAVVLFLIPYTGYRTESL